MDAPTLPLLSFYAYAAVALAMVFGGLYASDMTGSDFDSQALYI